MKITSRILSVVILLAVVTFYAGCKKDDPEKMTEEQTQLEKLKGSWALVSATMDGDTRTDDFPGLVLTLSGNYVEGGKYIYSFTGTRPDPSPWPVDGDWMFGNPKTSQMIRDPDSADEIPMTYTVTDANLTISFDVPDGAGWAGGSSRVQSVTGAWTFSFEKQ